MNPLTATQEQEARFRTLLDQLAAGVVVYGPDTKVLLANPAAERILGIRAEEMVGRDAHDSRWRFVDAQGEPLALADYPVSQVLASGDALTDFSMGVVADDASSPRWLLVNGRPTYDAQGEVREIVVSFFDISALRSAELRLRNAEVVFANIREGILVTDAKNRIIDTNPAFSDITGFQQDAVIGQNPRVLQSGRHDRAFYAQMWKTIGEQGYWRGEIWNRRADGQLFPEMLAINAIRDDSQQVRGYIGVFVDISASKAAESRLDHLAHHDSLTGLPNRLLLRATLGHAINRARRFGSLTAVAFVDLDRFKQVNDSLGHQAGDALLVEIAGRLTAAVRETDTVARVSGDEFVVLMEDLAQARQARVGIEKLMGAFESPFDLAGKQVRVTASIGVALYPQDGDEPEELIGNADTAMYSAKNEGRNSFQFFTAELTRMARETAVLDTALKNARQQDEFTLVYQPQFSIATGALVSAEALLRWRRPGLGEIPPGRFIEIAEQNGLIAEIGDWVLTRACEQAARWRREGRLALERIAVNISGQQVRTDAFAPEVLRVLGQVGLPPTALELEVTEHVLMRQLEHSVEQLVRLQNRGVSIAIDDFGTGYSSLSYLKVLPIDSLKIDQSFVRDIEADPDDRAIVASIIAMGKALRKSITAEGVETDKQLAFLKQRGCDKAQGFLLGRPMTAVDLERLLHRRDESSAGG